MENGFKVEANLDLCSIQVVDGFLMDFTVNLSFSHNYFVSILRLLFFQFE